MKSFLQHSYSNYFKRIFDLILSLLGIIICLPIYLLIALAIYLEDGRPVIFTQKRIGKNANIFNIYKFRSMIKEAESRTGPVWAYNKDYRITSVGNILRRTKLDELPQLFNIILGDMSFVGPRAERPELFDEIKKNVPGFENRLQISPGLTGIAQIYGNYNTHPKNKLRYDLIYIKNISLCLDFKLIILTIYYLITFRLDGKEKRIDKLIGQVILESGVINESQLNEALDHQEKWGGKIGEILIDKGYITEYKLKDYLSQQVRINSKSSWSNKRNDNLLGQIMLATKVISIDHLEAALKYQFVNGGKLGQILVDLGYISESTLIDCLEKQIKEH